MAAMIRCQLILSDNDFIDKTLNFSSCFSFVVCPTDNLTGELSYYRLFVLCVWLLGQQLSHIISLLFFDFKWTYSLFCSVSDNVFDASVAVWLIHIYWSMLIWFWTWHMVVAVVCVCVMWHADWLFLMHLFCFVLLSVLQGSLSLAAINILTIADKLHMKPKIWGFILNTFILFITMISFIWHGFLAVTVFWFQFWNRSSTSDTCHLVSSYWR